MLVLKIRAASRYVKLYAPAVALGAAGIISIVGSHGIMQKRSASMMAAYALLQEGYQTYRKRVIEAVGEEKERDIRYGVTEEEVQRQIVDETTGRKKKIKAKERKFSDHPLGLSQYARIFDESSIEYQHNPHLNLSWLKMRQSMANTEFQLRGHMFLNEVYDMLGFKRTPEGAMVGWVYDEKNPVGDNYIDFGIYDKNPNDETYLNSAGINGWESSFILDFNVDGRNNFV